MCSSTASVATTTQVQEDAEESQYTIGFFGGGFNPPHIGHFEAAKLAAQTNDDVYIIISPKIRDESDITLEKKERIWNLYKPLLEQYRAHIHIVVAQVTPITTTYEYVATLNESPEANNIIVNLYADAEDSARYGKLFTILLQTSYVLFLAGFVIIKLPSLSYDWYF